MYDFEFPNPTAEAYVDLINLCESETDMQRKERLEKILLAFSIEFQTLRESVEGYRDFQLHRFSNYCACGEYVIKRKTPSGKICCYPILMYKKRTS